MLGVNSYIARNRETKGRTRAASFTHGWKFDSVDDTVPHAQLFSVVLLNIDEWATSVTFGAGMTCGAAAPQRRRSKERNKKAKRGCTIKRRAWAAGSTDGQETRCTQGRPRVHRQEVGWGMVHSMKALTAERTTIRISVVTRTARAFFFTDTPGWRRNHWLNPGADPFFPSRDLLSLLSPGPFPILSSYMRPVRGKLFGNGIHSRYCRTDWESLGSLGSPD